MSVRSGSLALICSAAVLMAAFLLVAGCTGTSSSSSAPPRRLYTPQTTILIGSASANPQILVVDRGVTVTWLNIDMEYHTVTSDSGDPESFMSSPLAYNQEFQWTFTIPGTYGFHCTANSNIKGTIIVNP